MSVNQDHYMADSGSQFTHVINNINAGIWEYNIYTGEVKWADGFYRLLGYEPGEIECSYSFFYEQLLYHGDRKIFLKSTNDRSENKPSIVQIRLLTKDNGYQWFENTSWRIEKSPGVKIYGAIVNIHTYKLAELESEHKDLLFNETGKIARLALWEIDAGSFTLSLSEECYDIFELSGQVKLTAEEMISFFEQPGRDEISAAINNLIRSCRPFDLEMPFRTARNRVIWMKIKALPIIDNYGKCIRIRGILQDIDYIKKSQAALQQSFDLTNEQNKRLQNFAYIVSHNLRSHTGNLKFMVDLFKETASSNEKAEIFEHIHSISENLHTTVKHLEEIVKIQTEIDKDKKEVEFEPLFKSIVGALANNIDDLNARVEYDFTRLPAVNYVPAYMESILQNLLTNSLKYYQPHRTPVIKCTTYENGQHAYLTFEDNGKGIDMKRFGDQLFGMYKTFHKNPDAKGIGLFITRNQIESLGGSIDVESTVNVGTKFTIRLN
jgi:signal transduction histidine kinase